MYLNLEENKFSLHALTLNMPLHLFPYSVRENPGQAYQEMLQTIRDLLKDKYKQRPQLSSSRPMNMQEMFHM